jgi:hypothetical protein
MLGSPLRVSDRRITVAGRLTGTYSSTCCEIAAGASVCRRGGPSLTGDGIILALPAASRAQTTASATTLVPKQTPSCQSRNGDEQVDRRPALRSRAFPTT